MKIFSRHVRVEPLNRRKKDSFYRKNISGRGWQVGTRDRVTYNNSGNREKPFSRHWSFKQQHHSYCFIPFLRQKVFRNSFEACFSKRNHRSVMLRKISTCVTFERDTFPFKSFPCCRAGVPNLFLTMYPFSIPKNEHVPLQHFNR